MASVYSGAGDGNYGSVTVKGQVEFGLLYNYKIGALEVNVKRCRDLAIGDTKRNRTDPYVKVIEFYIIVCLHCLFYSCFTDSYNRCV